nr:energy transducer TonB [Stenotrophomonas sp. ISL-67]
MLIACVVPLPAMAAADCQVDPQSQQALPPMARPAGYPRMRQQAHDVSLRVSVDAQGNPIDVSVDGATSPDATGRSAMRWRYRCEGIEGVAEWVLHLPTQHCELNLTSKNFNPPRYPPQAFRAGIQGEVLVGLYPQGDGQVARQAIIAQSSGSALLDEAALTAARRWTFDCGTGMDGSEPGQEVPLTFSLN